MVTEGGPGWGKDIVWGGDGHVWKENQRFLSHRYVWQPDCWGRSRHRRFPVCLWRWGNTLIEWRNWMTSLLLCPINRYVTKMIQTTYTSHVFDFYQNKRGHVMASCSWVNVMTSQRFCQITSFVTKRYRWRIPVLSYLGIYKLFYIETRETLLWRCFVVV